MQQMNNLSQEVSVAMYQMMVAAEESRNRLVRHLTETSEQVGLEAESTMMGNQQ